MFAIDTNLLVHAHNTDSSLHTKANAFVTRVMNERDNEGSLSVCLPTQVLIEFIHVMTWQRMPNPLSLPEAISIIQDYLDTGVMIIYQCKSHLQTFLDLLASITSRKKIFDVALAAVLKDNNVSGLYTVNIPDFSNKPHAYSMLILC